MFNALFLRHRTSGLAIVAIFLGFAMLFCAGVNSANAQYNDYGYGNSYSNDYGYNNGYNYNDYGYDSGYSSSSSSSSSDSDDGNNFWWYVLAFVVFVLFGGQGLKAANAASKGKLDQKTNGFATNLSRTDPNGIGVVGNYIANQTNTNPNYRRR